MKTAPETQDLLDDVVAESALQAVAGSDIVLIAVPVAGPPRMKRRRKQDCQRYSIRRGSSPRII